MAEAVLLHGPSSCCHRGNTPPVCHAGTMPHIPTPAPVRLALAVLMLALGTLPARADPIRPQCWDCIAKLIMQLPADNPNEDPAYEQGLTPGSVLPALTQCSLDDSEIPTLQQIIGIFTDAAVN